MTITFGFFKVLEHTEEEVEGAYWFGPVCGSVCLCVRNALHTIKNG